MRDLRSGASLRVKAQIRGMSIAAVAAVWLTVAAPAVAADATVDVGNFLKFAPSPVAIDQGDSVTWRWVGPDVNHDVFSEPGQPELFESHPGSPSQISGPPPGGTFTHAFPTAGTFTYFCRVHPSMQGEVVVRRVDKPVPDAPGAPVSQLTPATCTSKRSFRIRIRQPRGVRITAASVTVNGKAVAVSSRDGRFTAPVDLRGLPKGSYRVSITARTAKGTTLRGARVYRTCDAKLSSSGLPKL
jgi:plastocyanin